MSSRYLRHVPVSKQNSVTMDLDEIFEEIGEFGRYQKLVLWFVLLPGVFPCGFHAYNQLFMAGVPEHWCKIPKFENATEEQVKNLR